MKYKFLLVFFSLLLVGKVSFALDINNTGIIPGQIWYSDELIEGNTVKVHTAVWNGSDNLIKTKVEFYDKNVVLGSRDVSVTSNELKDVYISWKVTAGDHIISAKIISSDVNLEIKQTKEDKQFVSKIVKKIDGDPVTSNDMIKNQIAKAGEKIDEVIPESVQETISEKFSGVDNYREETLVKINEGKEKTKTHLDEIKNDTISNSKVENTGIDGTDKPITTVKYFFLTVAGLIFANKIIFYGLIILISFFMLRSIWRKIRGR